MVVQQRIYVGVNNVLLDLWYLCMAIAKSAGYILLCTISISYQIAHVGKLVILVKQQFRSVMVYGSVAYQAMIMWRVSIVY